MDQHKNFSYSTILTAPSPADSGTSLVVASGQGALFPTPPFNCTVWPIGVNPLSTNAEIIRVTAIVGDTFTILRVQEGSSARSIIVGDQIAATITAKTLKDVEELDLGAITDSGNTTPNDIEITDDTKGLILPVTGGRRVRVTATDDGFGNLQLTLTEL